MNSPTFRIRFFCLLPLTTLLLLHGTLAKVTSRKLLPHDVRFLDVLMPSVKPAQNDDYICVGQKLPSTESFIIEFEPHADQDRVHHMLLFGCKDLFDEMSQLHPNHWNCGHSQLCKDMTILYAWGRNAPALHLPTDVGFRVGGSSSVNYLVLQVHYAHQLEEEETDSSGVTLHYTFSPQKFVGGIHLLSSSKAVIPPRKQKYSIDLNCIWDSYETIYPFAYRVHAHSLGVVISGYKYTRENNSWTLLAKGNPQWPQAFYPMDQVYQVSKGEILAARCTYNSSSRDVVTQMGATTNDEMCNLYIMYFTEPKKKQRSFSHCIDLQIPDLASILPAGSDQPLPANPELEEHAHNHFANDKQVYDKKADFAFVESPNWPIGANSFGQISAVDVDSNGNIMIFHRGNHVWNERSFDYTNRYKLIDEGPISTSTVITIDPKTQKILNHWGSGLFYLPHGLTIDYNGYVWLTDVALHQVFKFSISGSQPLLTLGQRFSPGSGEKEFCKPTSVAVPIGGQEFYVADGYCNNRIIRYSAEGKFLNQWGHADPFGYFLSPPPGALSIPHKIVVIENEQLLCVADREHGRVQCFSTPHGQFKFEIRRDDFNGRLFSIAYSKSENLLFAVAGPSLYQKKDVLGFVFNISTQELLGIFGPNSGTFNQPHDIAVSKDTDSVYVVEIGPNNLWKFSRNRKTLISNSKSKGNVFEFKTPIIQDSEPVPQTSFHTKQLDSSANQAFLSKKNGTFKSSVPFSSVASSNTPIAILFFIVPIALIIIASITISLRKNNLLWKNNSTNWLNSYRNSRSQEKFDLGRFIKDPQKDGFNRIPNDDNSEEEAKDNSDSEVEEFNASSITSKPV